MNRPRTVIYGRLAFVGMLLLALETWLDFGTEVRAALISLTGLCLYRADANARQWDRTSEEAIPKPAPPQTERPPFTPDA